MGDSTQTTPDVMSILNSPATQPPEGVIQNLDNPPNGNGRAIALAVICIFLTGTAWLLRAFSRLFLIKKLRIEDYLGLCAFGFYISTAWSYFRFLEVIGLFVHQWDIRGYQLVDMAYIVFVLDFSYTLNQLFVKTAILLEWARIFTPNRNRNIFFWVSRFLVFATMAVYIGSLLSILIGCLPPLPVWGYWIPGKCVIQRDRAVIAAAFNIILDFFILILPQKIIWNLEMNRGRKIGVSIIFSVGLLACACAVGRLGTTLVYIYLEEEHGTGDSTYVIGLTFLWIFAEETCALLVFSVPSIPKVFTGTSLGSKMLASWHSWKSFTPGLMSRQTPKAAGSSIRLWPVRTAGSAHSSLPVYRMDEETQAQGIAEPDKVHAAYMEEQSDHRDPRLSDTGILKTTELDQHHDSASRIPPDSYMERQHPWMK